MGIYEVKFRDYKATVEASSRLHAKHLAIALYSVPKSLQCDIIILADKGGVGERI